MGSKSNYLENALLNYVLGRTPWTPPDSVYVALYTVAPGENSSGTEVSSTGTGYTRVQVPNDTTYWPTTSNGQKSNAMDIVWPIAQSDWGTVVAWALCDAATGGNILIYGDVQPSRPVIAGDIPRFQAGTLVWSED